MYRSLLILPALLLLTNVSQGEESVRFQARIEDGIRRSLALIETASAETAKQRKCFTCHGQALPIVALVEAKNHGFSIDEANLKTQLAHTDAHLQRSIKRYESGKGTGGQVDTAGWALWALQAGNQKPDDATTAVVHYLTSKQNKAGFWKCGSDRPPSETSDFTTTYLALRGFQSHGDSLSEDDSDAIHERAAKWFREAKPVDTEDVVFQLLTLPYVEHDFDSRELIGQLKDKQRDDGGWSQKPDWDSDAYATSTVLYALREAGVDRRDPVVLRGLSYLIENQKTDGSWHVKSHSKPFQKYFETGYPHGKDQFISMTAGCWATIVLMQATEPPKPADLVLRDGRIAVVDSDFQVVSAMAVRDGRVVALGASAETLIGDDTRIIDLDGKMVLPGLIDSHVHPSGASMFEADHKIPVMESIDDVLKYVASRTEVVAQGQWIKVSQVFITRLREQRFPTRRELDSVAPNHPVFFRTGPDGSINSLALKENGIDKKFAADHPDHVMVDAAGEPNGIIRQTSKILKKTSAGSASKKLTQSERDDRLVQLFDDYNRWGITGIIDRNCNDSTYSQYVRLLNDDRLSIRIRASRSLNPRWEDDELTEKLDAYASDEYFRRPHPRLGLLGVKCFEDGGMLTGSAYFRKPWGVSKIYGIDDPAYRGMQYIDTDRLGTLVRECAQRNLAFTAHCQGDAAVEALVETYRRVNQQTPIAPTRSTITHSSFMSEKAIAGAAELGVGVDLQPAWLYLDARTLVSQFGDDRLEFFIPLQSLFRAGVIAGGGSDHMQKIGSLRSVNPYNPFWGMWIAVTRTARWHEQPIHPMQALSREQMIRFYTSNNAWLMRFEEEIGSLEIGKRADFVIIDRDLLKCRDEDIRNTAVVSTWLDGTKVFGTQVFTTRD